MNAHDLPLPDYDSLTVGSIEARARTLDTAGVRALLDYENEHAGRLQVVQLLRHRLRCPRVRGRPTLWWQSRRPCARDDRYPDPHPAGFTTDAGASDQPALARRPDQSGAATNLR